MLLSLAKIAEKVSVCSKHGVNVHGKVSVSIRSLMCKAGVLSC